MKTEEEIILAHDMLECAIEIQEEEGVQLVTPPSLERLHMAVDVLCWILGHSNQEFQINLTNLKKQLDLAGYSIIKKDDAEPSGEGGKA